MAIESMCVVCGDRDGRVLTRVDLGAGGAATLCGSHALMHQRARTKAQTASELRTMLSNRRSHRRRNTLDGDELAERLIAAFTQERRTGERRTG